MVPRREAWLAYLLMVCQGYLFYAVGYLTPYVESELNAPTWASALPNSMMATGLLVSAVLVPRVVRGMGDWGAVTLWALALAAAAVLMAFGASLPALLVGALVIGVAGAGSLTHSVTAFAGKQNGVLLMRATLASVLGGVVGPLVLSAVARSVGWSWGMLAAVPLAIGLAVAAFAIGRERHGPARESVDAAARESVDAAARDDSPLGAPVAAVVRDGRTEPFAAVVRDGRTEPSLGRAYWLAWTFLVLCIGAESSFVAWGAQVAVVQAGISLEDATALGSLFILGLIIGRIALGLGKGVGTERRRLLAAMAITAVAGGLLVWLGSLAALVGAGLLVGGLGLAGIWPTAAGVAMVNAPRSPVTAGARLNLASGVAILSAPLVLGVAAQAAGVLVAWGLVLGLLLAALAVLRLVPVPRQAAA